MDVKMEESWKKKLQGEFEKKYFENLIGYVKREYASQVVYPPGKLIFNAFDQCKFEDCKVVILGQDPYHGPGQANGLCFSVNDGIVKPPSLLNIFKEIRDDIGTPIPVSGNLERWAVQGVLLLNATLTVRGGQAGAHQRQGWETFTDTAIRCLSEEREGIVFMLWGKYAQDKGSIIDAGKHYILKSRHPSPMAASQGGWFGERHFSKANEYLVSRGQLPIKW